MTGNLPSPDVLMASTDVMFGMPSPAFIIWGPEHTLLYNEPFRVVAAATAQDTFGRPLPVGSRHVGDELALLVRGALSGQAVVRQHVHFGARARCTVSLPPLRQDDGAIGGAFGVCEYRENEARYQTLFDSIDECFCIIEFIDGPHGPLSDYVHTSANAAYAINTGIPNVVGQKVREMVPDEAAGWVKLYAEVLKTGQPIRFERELVATQRFLELAAFRVEPATRREVAVLFKDVTARKRAERALQDLTSSKACSV